jgi:hypothetical protein
MYLKKKDKFLASFRQVRKTEISFHNQYKNQRILGNTILKFL